MDEERVSRPAPAPGPAPRLAPVVAATVLAAALATPGAVRAQEAARADSGAAPGETRAPAADDSGGEGARLFPGESLMPRLDGDPLAPIPRGSFVLADRPNSDFPGTNIEAEVTLGHALPVALLQPEGPGRPALGLEFRVAMFSRFFMETRQRDLIAADFRVDFPFTVRYRGWEGRIGYQHFSAHLADDFVRRFEPELTQHSRDGLEAAVARRLPGAGLRLYLGGRYNFHANPGVHESAARAGVEWDPGERVRGEGGVWPFAAADFEIRDNTDEVAGTGSAGVLVRIAGQAFRLEARGHFGPSPMGQLSRTDDRFAGLGLRIDF